MPQSSPNADSLGSHVGPLSYGERPSKRRKVVLACAGMVVVAAASASGTRRFLSRPNDTLYQARGPMEPFWTGHLHGTTAYTVEAVANAISGSSPTIVYRG